MAWFAAASFVCLTVPISLWEIAEHLHHYTCPSQQKHIVRILWFVPIYAIDSLLAMIFKDLAIYINTGRECYEAFVIYSFVHFLINAIGGEDALEQVLVLQSCLPITCTLLQAMERKPPMHHMMPFCWCSPWAPKDFYLP